MLGLQAGSADMLGVPFTDLLTDGVVIQQSNAKALENSVDIHCILQLVRTARAQGLTVPVLLMGYYNPVRAYEEERLLLDNKAAGVNGADVARNFIEDYVRNHAQDPDVDGRRPASNESGTPSPCMQFLESLDATRGS
ncbi:hypothetical protein P170DRAFT_467853 [Aspergillus steynii IBT 23096]|uniref:tryptophan synthase n=1 Tax=Aspergillus steynii IBT 23096 TaxID=1392250 RepID=A0A2I2FXG4_9EURO|nr:uncharacterized protein P170DRAFT_467853 [Aspergillus steynii IBT 23096]PLB45325.1 hypothetical protein P170DRAFT_467853 [Aspergillus steynii IBT 23096]